MIVFNELTEDNLFLYAAKHYRNPQFTDIEEFYEDLKRFKYIKRLINRYIEHDELAERLLLNHLIRSLILDMKISNHLQFEQKMLFIYM